MDPRLVSEMVPSPQSNEKLQFCPGVHAAISHTHPGGSPVAASLEGHMRDADAFPRMDAHAWARRRMLRAALTSRSCRAPQGTHTQCLTINPLTPRGPLRHPHEEQVTLVFFSQATENDLAACWLLYSRKLLSMPKPLSYTALATRVFRSLATLMSTTTVC